MWTKVRATNGIERPQAELIFNVGAILLFLGGLVFRVWLAGQPVGRLDSDGAVIGLMAIRFLSGEFSAMYWGQGYGGSQEAIAAAALFAVTDVSSMALKLVPVAFNAISAILVWRVGRRLLGETYGKLAGVLFWIWPPFFLLWSLRMGTYWASLASALLVFLQVLRIKERVAWRWYDAPLLGLAIGNALWANPQTVYVLIPVLLVHAGMFVKRWRHCLVSIPFMFVGALPWLIFNFRNSWASFEVPSQPSLGPLGHLSLLLRRMLPMSLGFRYPYSDEWLWGVVGKAAYFAAALVLGILIIRFWKKLSVLWIAFLIYPIVYAVSPYSWYDDEPRYLLFLIPFICLSAAAGLQWVLPRPLLALSVCLIIAVGLGIPSLGQIRRVYVQPTAPDVPLPNSFAQLEDLLLDEGVRVAYADYWIAYRTTFETEEKVVVAPLQVHRYLPYDQKVGSSIDPPPFIFVKGSGSLDNFDKLAKANSIDYELVNRGPWLLAWPEEPISPWELAILNGHYPSSG